MNLFDSTISGLEQALGYSTSKNKAITNNIANIDTPNYKSQDVSFKNVFRKETDSLIAQQTHEKHLSFDNESQKIKTNVKHNSDYNNNKNNVDIDKEMAEMAKNQIYYHSMIDRLNGKFSSLQTVLRGGNG